MSGHPAYTRADVTFPGEEETWNRITEEAASDFLCWECGGDAPLPVKNLLAEERRWLVHLAVTHEELRTMRWFRERLCRVLQATRKA